jgi:hypothetical protein
MPQPKKTLTFYRGTTVRWEEDLIAIAGVPQNITADVIQFTVKRKMSDPDDEAIIKPDDVTVDVTTTANKATFEISKTDSDVPEGNYPGEATWMDGDDEHVLRQYDVTCLARVEDVPGS